MGRECSVDVTEYHFLVGRLLGDELPVVVYGEVHLLRGEAQPLPDLAPKRLGHSRPHQRRQLPRPRTSGRPGVQNLRPAGKLQLRTLLTTLKISNAAAVVKVQAQLHLADPAGPGEDGLVVVGVLVCLCVLGPRLRVLGRVPGHAGLAPPAGGQGGELRGQRGNAALRLELLTNIREVSQWPERVPTWAFSLLKAPSGK